MWRLIRPGYIGPNLPSYRATPLRLIRKLKRSKPSTEPPTQTRGKVACTASGELRQLEATFRDMSIQNKKYTLRETNMAWWLDGKLPIQFDDFPLNTYFPVRWLSSLHYVPMIFHDLPMIFPAAICKPPFLSGIFQAPGWHRRYLAPRRCAELVCCEPGWIAGVPPPCCEAPDGITTLYGVQNESWDEIVIWDIVGIWGNIMGIWWGLKFNGNVSSGKFTELQYTCSKVNCLATDNVPQLC